MKTIHSTITTSLDPALTEYPLTEILFFDIETTGLSPKASSLYLIGVMYYDASKNNWQITQWFADNYQSEKQILLSFLERLERYSCLYHFNGKTFDIPYVLHKCEKYALSLSEHNRQILQDKSSTYSIDILAQIRPLKKLLSIPKAGQTDLERWLGIHREDSFHGGELIPIYSEFMQAKLLHPEHADKLERILLLHNHDDMEGMLSVCRILAYQKLFRMSSLSAPQLQITEVTATNDQLCLSFTHHLSLPKEIKIQKEYPCSKSDKLCNASLACTIALTANTGVLTLPVLQTELKYFFQNYKDYYYLPEEDQAMHKSVAQFMDPSCRQRATAATSYQRKEAAFIPSLSSGRNDESIPIFYSCYRDKLCFYQLPAALTPEDPFWISYLQQQLNAIL